MKFFISWSGNRSKLIAQALAELLPEVLQQAEPWMSAHDIDAGARWASALGAELESSSFGVLCLTPENLDSRWLLFEAGSLSKSVTSARVVPYLFRLHASDVTPPLSQFQGVDATAEGTYSLIESMNARLATPLPEERLRRVFGRWWPDFKERLDVMSEEDRDRIQERPDRQLLDETLEIVRDLQHDRQRLLRAPAVIRQALRHPKYNWRKLETLAGLTGLDTVQLRRVLSDMEDVEVKTGEKTGTPLAGFTEDESKKEG